MAAYVSSDSIVDNITYQGISVPVQESLLPENVILLSVKFAGWGDETQADKSLVIVDANKSRLSLTKQLLDCKELEAIKAHRKQVGKKLARRALPASKTIRSGFYRVPVDLLAEIDSLLEQERRVDRELIENFLDAYQGAKYKASLPKEEGGLGVLYNEADYPPQDVVRSKFSFTWSYLTFSVPDALPEAIRRREREQFRTTLQQGLEECKEALRVGFTELIERATDRLRSKEDGRPMKYTSSLQEQMTDFLSYFSARNSLAQDDALATLVDKARRIMSDCPDLNALKSDSVMREKVQARFAEIQRNLSEADIVPMKKRAILIESKDEEA